MKPLFARRLRIDLTAFLTAIAALLPAALWAGFGNDEFEEDPSVPQGEELDWPEIEFPETAKRGAGFAIGETFEYRAQWGIFRKAGRMVISTASESSEQGEKLVVNTITASAGLIRRLYPLTHTARTVLDPDEWRMEVNEVDGQARSDVNRTRTEFDYENGLMKYEDKAEPEHSKVRELPYPFPLDYSSSFLQLRGYDLKVGAQYPVFVCSKGKFYLVEMQVIEMDEIDTEMGDRDCFRLEPISAFPQSKLFREGGKMSIWITADQDRLPVRFDVKTSVGTATMRLESYTKAEPAIAAR